MPQTTPTCSDVLKDEFEKKRAKNPTYSIRAFARDLRVSSGTASLLVRGKVGLSQKRAAQIAKQLGFNTKEAGYFADLARAQCARGARAREEARLRLRQYDTRFDAMEIHAFRAISQWYSLPIMELIRMHGDKADAAFISRRLGISEQEARDSMSTLRGLQILQVTKNGAKIAKDFVYLPDGPPDAVVRKLHQQILEKARAAVTEQPKPERNISYAVVRARKKDLPWIAKEIRAFRRKLAARIEEGEAHDSVYALSVQFLSRPTTVCFLTPV